MTLDDLDTPALLIDLDRVEANAQRWQACCDKAGVKNRPHIKTHKIPELALLQIQLGACGITCQKLGEAEAMADGGVSDIFLAYNLVGEPKLQRLRALHERTHLRVVADGREVVEGLARAMAGAERPLEVLVECDTGMHRIGVQTPEEAVELARHIAAQTSLRFAGFCTYPASAEAVAFMEAAKRLCTGLAVPEISGGGTPGMWGLPGYGIFSEYRAGTYLFYDRITVAAGVARLEDCALTVLTTVVSTSGTDWVTLDGGTKTFSSDQYGQTGFGCVLGEPQSVLTRCSEEHGVLQTAGAKPRTRVGEKLRIIPNHACIVSNLHDTAYAVRGEKVVAQWAITARGKLQ